MIIIMRHDLIRQCQSISGISDQRTYPQTASATASYAQDTHDRQAKNFEADNAIDLLRPSHVERWLHHQIPE